MPKLVHYTETESTNTLLKELLQRQEIDDEAVIYTDYQTSGRGQRGNVWESERGKNILFSMLIYPDMVKASEPFIISQLTSLAIKDILSQYTDNISIKWPNDIYYRNKKICGILIENSLAEDSISQSILGCGININQTVFYSDAPNPVSLKQITGKEYVIKDILAQIADRISYYYHQLQEGKSEAIITNYKSSLFRRDGFHLFDDGKITFYARIYDVENTGHIILKTNDNKLKSFAFKEIRYIL